MATRVTNGSSSDVQSKINAASNGDIITLPAGTFAWSSTVTSSNKALTIQGAGKTATVITNNAASAFDISVINDQVFTLKDLRVHGGSTHSIDLSGSSRNMRLTNLAITGVMNRGIVPWDAGVTLFPLIDHCDFTQGSGGAQCVSIFGAGVGENGGWALPSALGTYKAVYMEDCTFDYPVDYADGCLDCYGGGRYVFRHNIVRGTNIGHHGTDSGGYRSTNSWEIYENTWYKDYSHAIWTPFNSRGGTGIVFGNKYYDNNGSFGGSMLLQNYRSCGSYESWGQCQWGNAYDGNEDPPHNGYPCLDQNGMGTGAPGSQTHQPIYHWTNLGDYGGSPYAMPLEPQGDCAAELTHIVENRDFFAASTGTGTPANGTIVNQGYWNSTTRKLYQWNGSTWVLYYEPYTYPHPLQGTATPPVGTPVLSVR